MGHTVAHVPFEGLVIDLTPEKPFVAAPSCCERAVTQALETADAMRSTTVVAMLIVGVAMMAIGFVAGLTAAWMIAG